MLLKFINKIDILLIPYTYIFNSNILSIIGLELKDKIIIIDEAHNIKNIAKSSYSSSEVLVRDLKQVLNLVKTEQ